MRKTQIESLTLVLLAFVFSVISLMAGRTNELLNLEILDKTNFIFYVLAVIVVVILIVKFIFDSKIYKGFDYFWNYWRTKNGLELQMIDANFGIDRSYYTELPKIKLTFNDDFSAGTLKIRNTLKFDNKLDNVIMSSALGKFIAERHYQTDDGNYHIYELVDSSESFKQTFESFDKFLEHNKTIDNYKLFLDKRSNVKLQHTLLVGMTGSGKTYSLYSLILQMLNKDIPYEIYYADPKGSSLAVIGSIVAEDKTAIDIDNIIEKLDEFVSLMSERKEELKEKLKQKIDADYSDFGLSPYIFICDEYASFSAVILSRDKKCRDKVNELVAEIVLQGRQLGFFWFIVMQKSDASLINTYLRDNIPLKIVLGNSEQQTYVTAFGLGVDIPNRNYLIGEGVFTEPVLAPEPKLVQFPFCDFDILEAIHQTPVM